MTDRILHGSRPDRHTYFIEMATLVAKRSTCLRRAVGCVLVNDVGHVLATGYNGVHRGQSHCNQKTGEEPNPALLVNGRYREPEHWEQATIDVYSHACAGAKSPSGTNLNGCQAIHAEQNALIQCRNINEIHTAYITASPCINCMRLLANTSVRCIVFKERYPHVESEQLASYAAIEWVHWPG